MKAKKKVAVVCLSIGAVLLLLTAFSGVNAWNQEGDTGSTGQAEESLTAEEAAAGNQDVTEPGIQLMSLEEEAAEETTAAQAEETAAETADAQTETSAQEPAADETTAAPEEIVEDAAAAPEGETVSDESSALEQAEIDYFEGQFMVTVTGNTALNVREEPSTESA